MLGRVGPCGAGVRNQGADMRAKGQGRVAVRVCWRLTRTAVLIWIGCAACGWVCWSCKPYGRAARLLVLFATTDWYWVAHHWVVAIRVARNVFLFISFRFKTR